MTSNEVDLPTPPRPRASIATVIKQMQPEIARALPKHLDADRVARLALTAVRKNPKLADCTPESFAGALMTAAALGLEPDVNGECYLVPYDDRKKRITECQLIIGYQGFAKQFYQSPLAAHLDAQAVRENDEFDYAYGLNPFLRHKPARGDRGPITDYYAVATLTSGASAFVVLSPDEVKDLRRGRVGSSGNIPDPQHWMERKTVLRQLIKLLPKSPSLHQAATVDERMGSDLYRDRLRDTEAVADVTALPEAPQDVPHDGLDEFTQEPDQ